MIYLVSSFFDLSLYVSLFFNTPHLITSIAHHSLLSWSWLTFYYWILNSEFSLIKNYWTLYLNVTLTHYYYYYYYYYFLLSLLPLSSLLSLLLLLLLLSLLSLLLFRYYRYYRYYWREYLAVVRSLLVLTCYIYLIIFYSCILLYLQR